MHRHGPKVRGPSTLSQPMGTYRPRVRNGLTSRVEFRYRLTLVNRVFKYWVLLVVLALVAACADASLAPSAAPISQLPDRTEVAAVDTPGATPVEVDTPQPTSARTPRPTKTPRLTPAPTLEPPPTPTPEPTAKPTATPVETPESTPTPTPTPTATPDETPSPSPSGTPAPPDNMVLLGSWTTHFIPSVLNGNGVNIRVPAQRLDGTIVKPGQLFQFIDSIEPVTEPPFAKGAFIRNGQFVLDPEKGILGGGMCSASTTLFNAALRAGLKIVERHNHAVYISRYPVGLDATVFSTGQSDGQDVKFVNDTGHNIVIKAVGAKRKVVFQVWGVDDGRSVKLSDPVVTNIVKAPDLYEYTDDLPAGDTHRSQARYDGFHSSVTRTVLDRNGNVIWSDTFNSSYRMLSGIILLGRAPGDPPAGTRIPVDPTPDNG